MGKRKKGFWGEKLDRRVNERVRYPKPYLRKTTVEVKGKKKEYFHYVIYTTIPEKWKDGVKVTIEPLRGLRAREARRAERDLNEMGEAFRELVEKHLDEEAQIAADDEERNKARIEAERLRKLTKPERLRLEEEERKRQEEEDKEFPGMAEWEEEARQVEGKVALLMTEYRKVMQEEQGLLKGDERDMSELVNPIVDKIVQTLAENIYGEYTGLEEHLMHQYIRRLLKM